jgi:hypothetical protein
MEQAERIPIIRVPAVIAESTGAAPQLRTVRRWVRNGYRGVKLRVAGFGRDRFTTREWLDQFAESCGCEDRSFERPLTESTQQRRSGDAADAILRKHGIIE